MSIKLMTIVLERPEPSDPMQRFVLLVLADQASEPLGKCWPSIAQISNRTKLSERSVQRAIRTLQKGGWIDIVDGGRTEGGRRANDYYVHREAVNRSTPMGDTQSPHGCHTVTPGVTHSHPRGDNDDQIGVTHSHPRGDNDDQIGVTHSHPRGVPVAPQSSFNPNIPTVRQPGDGGQPVSLLEAQRFFVDHQATESEAESFFDFYETSGWKMNTGRPLASWQAAARRWIRTNRERAQAIAASSGPKNFGSGGAGSSSNPTFGVTTASPALNALLNDPNWTGGPIPDPHATATATD